MTVLADSVFGEINSKKTGVQMVVGADYTIWDFVQAVKDGSVRLKSPNIGLLIGNNHIKRNMQLNMGKQVGKLVEQIAITRRDATIYVCSLMVRPDDELGLQQVVIRANKQIHGMCQEMTKRRQIDARYVPLHQEYLEKWKHFDVKSGQMRITTRISRPYSQWFMGIGCKLNQEGIDRAMTTLWRAVTGEIGMPMRKVTEVDELQIKVLREEQKESSTCGERLLMGAAAKMDPGDSVNTHNKFPLVRSKEMAEQDSTLPDEKIVAGRKRTCEQGSREPLKKGKVAALVGMWESKTVTAVTTDRLDVELGKESVVKVDLGEDLQSE